jgi:hypothetical protein
MATLTKCEHPIKDVIWTGEWIEEHFRVLGHHPVQIKVRRLLCLGCSREFEVEYREP